VTPSAAPSHRPSATRGRRLGDDAAVEPARHGRLLEDREAGRGASERAGDGDDVVDSRGGPQHGMRRLAEQRDVDEPAAGGRGGVAADHGDPVLAGEREQAFVERVDLVGRRGAGARQRHQRPARAGALGGEVGDVHRKGLPPHVGGARVAAAEVDVLDEQVGLRDELGARRGGQHRAVVADPHDDAVAVRRGGRADPPD